MSVIKEKKVWWKRPRPIILMGVVVVVLGLAVTGTITMDQALGYLGRAVTMFLVGA